MKAGICGATGKLCGPGPISARGWNGIKSVCAVLVFITGNRILRVGGVVSIVIYGNEAHMAIYKSNDTFGIAIKRRILARRLGFVPRERRVRGPFHHQQGSFGMVDVRKLKSSDVWHAGQSHTVENVAVEIKTRILMEGNRIRITPVIRTGEHGVAGGRFSV